MKTGAVVPLHHHPEEAVDVLLQGVLEMQIGEAVEVITSGTVTVVPPNVPHKAMALEDCKVITVFYPQRG